MRTRRLSSWHFAAACCFVAAAVCTASLPAQFQANGPGQGGPNANAAPVPGGGPGFGNNNGFGFGPAGVGTNGNPNGNGRGGSQNADFDSLIDLIVSTVATDTWAENGGGTAEVRPFYNGVLIDTAGLLQTKLQPKGGSLATDLTAKRGSAPPSAVATRSAAKASTLRFVSLPRLEREIARRQKEHLPLDPAMLTLAGMTRVKYVFAYPETSDIVLAGPAGDWVVEGNRIVSKTSHQPVVRLDDVLVLLRRGAGAANSHFGCSINPRQENLAKTQDFLTASSKKAIEPSQRTQWLGDLRDTVGRQDIEIFGVDPASRLAAVLVEADYHMKLIGMGLAEGVDGVDNYLDSLAKAARQTRGPAIPPMSVLRWWFALKYDAIPRSEANDAFEFVGQGVRVLSESEILAAQGQRVHTGQSDPLNRQFAESFTAHFDELATKYPVYGELRNIFDLALAAAIIQNEGLVEKVGWKPSIMMSAEQLRVPKGNVPREVDTVINHRVVNGRTILAGVSGGVMVAPSDVLKSAHANESAGTTIKKAAPAPTNLPAENWWWDEEGTK